MVKNVANRAGRRSAEFLVSSRPARRAKVCRAGDFCLLRGVHHDYFLRSRVPRIARETMSSIAALANALYREEVARARAMRPADKLLEGPRLFDRACRLMAEGIRHQHPEFDDAGVRALLAARLIRLHELERR